MTPYEQRQKMIADILNEFDFDKVHLVMKSLSWRWGFDAKIPSIDDLRYASRERMEGAMKGCLDDKTFGVDTPYVNSSGGLKATTYKDIYGQINYLQLEFVLTEWDSNIED